MSRGGPGVKARLAVKAVPRASRNALVGRLGDRLKVRIAAPPQDGRANDALEAFLADVLGVPARDVRIVAGHGSTSKLVEVDGLDQGKLDARIEALLSG